MTLAQREYTDVERWLITSTSQWLSVSIQLGILLSFIQHVTFSNLAFGWQTTLGFGGEGMVYFCEWITAPWSWFIDVTPTAKLITQTQYLHGQPFNSQLSQSWWPTLGMILLMYGLIPRVLILLYSQIQYRRALRQVNFTSGRYQALYERLYRGYLDQIDSQKDVEKLDTRDIQQEITINHLTQDEAKLSTVIPDQGLSARQTKEKDPIYQKEHHTNVSSSKVTYIQSCFALIWESGWLKDSDLQVLVRDLYRWDLQGHGVVGDGDIDADENVLHQFKVMIDHHSIVLFVEDWIVPSQDILDLITDIRQIVSGENLINIIPLSKKNGHWGSCSQQANQNWVEAIERLDDSNITLVTLEKTQTEITHG